MPRPSQPSRRVFARTVTRLVMAAALVVPAMAIAQSSTSRAVNGPAISMYGDLKYPAGFTHFEYTNAEAPKGGDVKMAAFGTYDTLNPFTLKGVAAAGLGETFDSLMVGSADEAFS
jgi:microcin C transport system substrate-binding protein